MRKSAHAAARGQARSGEAALNASTGRIAERFAEMLSNQATPEEATVVKSSAHVAALSQAQSGVAALNALTGVGGLTEKTLAEETAESLAHLQHLQLW